MPNDNVYNSTESQRGVRNRVITYRNDNGWLHNTQGPAIIYPNGTIVWALDGAGCNFDYWCKRVGVSEKQRLLLKIQYPNT